MAPKHAPSLINTSSSFRPHSFLVASRCIHSSRAEKAALTARRPSAVAYPPPTAPKTSPLSHLPLSQVLRTYLITSVSSSPALLSACSSILMRMLNSTSPLTSVDRNPVLKFLLRETFYKQFCGGTNEVEVKQYMKQLLSAGYNGVILEYALEVLKADVKTASEAKDVATWRKGMLDTVAMTNADDFVGLKWSGMGAHALQLLKTNQPPSPLMDAAMREVCDLAAAKNVRLLPAAEETTTTPCIDAWSLKLQQDYNRGANGAVVYNTYQAYLKQTPAQLAKHLADAGSEGYTLGIKLVRGAYLGSETRDLIWSSIEETHAAYDSLAAALLRRQYSGMLHALPGTSSTMPEVNVVLATHNSVSVRKAQAIRTKQTQQKEAKVPLVYAQLQGMADEVTCELVQAGKADAGDGALVDVPKAYKCTTWGSMSECLNYLLRRAAENKDAAGRTSESKLAMAGELRRRFKGMFGLA